MGNNRESSILEHLVHWNIVSTLLYTLIHIYTHFWIFLVLREAKRPLWWAQGNIWEVIFGRSTLPSRSANGSEWQFYCLKSYWQMKWQIYWQIYPSWYWHLVVKNGNFTFMLADLPPSMQCIMGCILWDVFGSHFGFFKKRWEFAFISE